MCLPACASQEPTADVHAVELGDTEKQVIEKAGEPDTKYGLGYDVFDYITNELEPEEKFFWLRNDKVVMIATYKNNDFTNWLVDESYAFQSIKRPRKFRFGNPVWIYLMLSVISVRSFLIGWLEILLIP